MTQGEETEHSVGDLVTLLAPVVSIFISVKLYLQEVISKYNEVVSLNVSESDF